MSAPPQQDGWTAHRREPRPPRAARARAAAKPDRTRPEGDTNSGEKPGGAESTNARRPATRGGQKKQTQQDRERSPQPQETKEQPSTNNRAHNTEKPAGGTPESTKAQGTETERRKNKPDQKSERERESTRKNPRKDTTVL
ncbi:MAG: hypothetical protein AAFQ14_07310 [Cyanobacteria bacterium J06621_12]